MNNYILVMFVATFFSALSQLLLKISANEKHDTMLDEYLNKKVITAYLIFAIILLVNTWCFTHVDLKIGPVIDTCSYVFVMILSFFILKEHFTNWKLAGNALIIVGILVYSIQPFG